MDRIDAATLSNGVDTSAFAATGLTGDLDGQDKLFPEHLAAQWDALPRDELRMMVAGPWKDSPSLNYRSRTQLAVRMLHHQGWTLLHTTELAGFFPDGLGKLLTHRALIVELWAEVAAEAAAAEAKEKVHADFLARTSATALLRRQFAPEEHLLGSLITRTTRTFLVGATGAGKTNLGLAMAGGIASGQGFGKWRSCRPARVLYVDGEMPLSLLQSRLGDVARRLGGEDMIGDMLHLVSWEDADSLLPPADDARWAPLNSPEGQAFILRLCDLIKPDVIFLDNVQSLVSGDMTTEVPWNETQPLAAALTARQIGQVWFDHTGHNKGRQYGASRKSWGFDTVGIIQPIAAADLEPGDLAFSLNFDEEGKARRRTPDNWHEYAPCVIRLRDDKWTIEGSGAGSAKATGPKLNEEAVSLYRHITAELADGAGRVEQMVLKEAPVPTLERKVLLVALIARGWIRLTNSPPPGNHKGSETLPENSPISGNHEGSVTDAEHKRLYQRLTTLQNKGLIGFNRHQAWLVKRPAEA